MKTKSLFVSLFAGAMVASGAAFAADMPVKAKPVSTSPWVLDLHGSFDYNFANTRVTGGGMYLYSRGTLSQPSVSLQLDIYKNPNTFINKFYVFGGIWNEFWSSPPAGGRVWQEMDWWAGAGVTFAKYVTVSAQALQFNFPGGAGAPPTARNYVVGLSLDDSFLGLPIQFNPYMNFFYNATGGSTVALGNRSNTYRFDIGIVPGYSFAKAYGVPFTVTFPMQVTVGPSSYWNRADGTTNLCGPTSALPCSSGGVGYTSVGIAGKYLLTDIIPTRLGTWYVKAGASWVHVFNETLLGAQVAVGSATTFPNAKRDIGVYNAGFGFSF